LQTFCMLMNLLEDLRYDSCHQSVFFECGPFIIFCGWGIAPCPGLYSSLLGRACYMSVFVPNFQHEYLSSRNWAVLYAICMSLFHLFHSLSASKIVGELSASNLS
jgi:hypothetical protein